jgi:hypothetical protein
VAGAFVVPDRHRSRRPKSPPVSRHRLKPQSSRATKYIAESATSECKSQPWANAALRDALFESQLIISAPRFRLGNLRAEDAALDLVRFDRLEKRLKIAFAKTSSPLRSMNSNISSSETKDLAIVGQ